MIITCPNCSTRYSLPQEKIKPGGQKVRCVKCGTVWHQEPDEPEPPAPAEALPPDEPGAAAEPAGTRIDPPEAGDPAPWDPVPAAGTAFEPAPPAATVVAAALPEPPPETGPGQFMRQEQAVEETAGGRGRLAVIAIVVLLVAALGAVIVFKQQIQDLTGLQLVPVAAPQIAAPAAAPPPAAAPAPAKPKPPEPPKPMTLTLEDVESSIEEMNGVRKLMVKGVVSNPDDREQAVPALVFDMMDDKGNALERWTIAPPVKALAPHTTTRFSAQRDTPPGGLHELVPGFDIPQNPPPQPAPAETAAPAASAPAKPQAAPAR
jgi:predicted Zn finger-like uncharacterized protein